MIRKTLTERKKEVKNLLSKVGMSFFDNRDTNEFLVWPKGDKKGEDSTYFTLGRTAEDLEDALRSGLDMARRIKKQNPRCRTFQVKRKVGKKTIQVRRKVCRNPINYNWDNKDLEKLIDNEVKLYLSDKHDKRRLLIIGKLKELPNVKFSHIKNMRKWEVYNNTEFVNFISYEIEGIDRNNIYIESY